MSLGTSLQQYAEALATDLDVPVVVDARDLTLPGILLTPGTMQFNRLDGTIAQLTIDTYLIAGQYNTITALDELTDLLQKLREHLGDEPSEAEPITLQLAAQGPDALPALLTQITVDLTLGETP